MKKNFIFGVNKKKKKKKKTSKFNVLKTVMKQRFYIE